MRKIKLHFHSVSEIVGTKDVGLLILLDEDEKRQLTIACDRQMMYQFELRLQHLPIAERLLPEVMWQVISTQSELRFEIIINDIIDGQYRAVLYNIDTLEPVALRASDAVLLAYIGKIPLYIEEGLMDKQSVKYVKEASGVSIPVNTISDDMLQKALDKAIADENYELASHLRDEMKRRKGNGQ